jgi:outer membrane protease
MFADNTVLFSYTKEILQILLAKLAGKTNYNDLECNLTFRQSTELTAEYKIDNARQYLTDIFSCYTI